MRRVHARRCGERCTHFDSGVRARLPSSMGSQPRQGSRAQCEKACKIPPAHRHIRSVMCPWRESKFFAHFFSSQTWIWRAILACPDCALDPLFFLRQSQGATQRESERARVGRQPLQPSSPKLAIVESLVSALLIVCHRLTLSAIPHWQSLSRPLSPLCSSSHASHHPHHLCFRTSTFSPPRPLAPPLAPTSSAAAKLPPPVYLFIRRSSSVSLRLSSSLFALTSFLPSHTPSKSSAKLRIRPSSSLPTPFSSSSPSLVTDPSPA